MALTLINYTANNTTAVQGAYRNKYDRLLTEWDTTTIPKIAGGAVIEVGGAAYNVVGDETIGGTAPATAGTYYIKVTAAGPTATVAWETSKTAYAWSDANGGWYSSAPSLLLPVSVVRYGSDYFKYAWIDIRSQDIIGTGNANQKVYMPEIDINMSGQFFVNAPAAVDTASISYRPILILDSSGRPIGAFANHTGRLDLYDYSGAGSVAVLYNFDSTPVDNQTAGHYAFGSLNDAGNANSVAYIVVNVTDISETTMSSKMTFAYMNNKDTSGGYSQPNQGMVLSEAGLELPTLPITGVTDLTASGTVSATTVSATTNIVAGDYLSAGLGRGISGSLDIPTDATLGDIYDALAPFLTASTHNIVLHGSSYLFGEISLGEISHVYSRAVWKNATTITLYWLGAGTDITTSSTTVIGSLSLAW